MVILGIDPGLATTGFALIRNEGNRQTLVECGVLTTDKGEESPRRLLDLFNSLLKILKRRQVGEVAMESLFFNTNAKTVILVGQASGVVKLAAARSGIDLFEYTPLQVKIALAGYGRADKFQIGKMVKQTLGLPAVPKPDDAADAVAIALCHCYSRRLIIRS